MQNQVDFRFSDSDLSAYLLMKGYIPSYIEVKVDKRHRDKLKAFIHFNGDKDEFIKLQEDYNNKEVSINLKEFSIARQQINKMIKNELVTYSSI